MWASSAAKPINKQKEPFGTDCKVVNPITGHVFDLGLFKDQKEKRIDDGRNGYFMIKICSAFTDQNRKFSHISSVCI